MEQTRKYDDRMYDIFEDDAAIDDYIERWNASGLGPLTTDCFLFPVRHRNTEHRDLKRCSYCELDNVKDSKVYSGFCIGTLGYRKNRYNEKQYEDEPTRVFYNCSNGHQFYEESGRLYKEGEITDEQAARIGRFSAGEVWEEHGSTEKK